MDAARSMLRCGKLPLGLLGMLVLVASVEGFVTRHELDTVPPEEWQYLLARQAATRQARGCDLLILGDSQAKMGVLPKVVGARSRLRSYNLAITGAQTPASYDVLRRALDGGAHPSAVLVDFHQFLLAIPPHASRAKLPFLLGYGAVLRLGWDSRDLTLLADLLAQRALPSFRCRWMLRSWVLSANDGQTNRNRLLMPEALGHWARNDGAWVMSSMTDQAGDGVAQQRLAYRPGWTPDRVNADYVRRFLQLSEANSVAVYWLIPPIHPALQAANEASGFDEKYVAFVRKMQQRFPGLTVIDGRHAGYDPAVFVNPDHLGREGAFALSQDLGDMFRRFGHVRPSSRWVALPRYRPRVTDPEILAARLDVFVPEPAPSTTR